MKLSILLPGIRVGNWERLYNSVKFKGEWELIIISPYDLPEEMLKDNVRLIKSHRSPLQAQQIGLTEAKGEWITWASDDGVFTDNYANVHKHLNDDKTIIVSKYLEGDDSEHIGHEEFETSYSFMESDKYYYLKTHAGFKGYYIPDGVYTLSFATISKKLLYELGGWDCRFEVCPMAFCDFSIRAKKHGCEFIILDGISYQCGHMPGTTGDHAPIHYGQTEHDEPLFKKMYNDKANEKRIAIPLDNWKDTPETWERRFSK